MDLVAFSPPLKKRYAISEPHEGMNEGFDFWVPEQAPDLTIVSIVRKPYPAWLRQKTRARTVHSPTPS